MSQETRYTIINKHLMAVSDGGSYRRILPNLFEAVKAECIADAKGRLSKFLPYFRVNFNAEALPDLESWRRAFSSDNPPEKVKFDERLEDAIKDVDFSKPFDAEAAERIRARFEAKRRKQADVDADLIIQGGLGELDE